MTRNTYYRAHGIICVAAAALILAGCGSITKSAIKGNVEGVKKYMARGESVNTVDRWGWTPLMWTAYYNYYEVAKCLLENGANVNARAQYSYGSIEKDSTALIIASYYGNDGLVRLLLSHGADKSIQNAKGMTAMDIAAQYNMTAVIDLLGGAPVRKARPVEEPAVDSPQTQTITLTDGSRIVGTIVSQTRTTVTVQTRYTTMTIEKSKISEMKYK